MVLKHNRTMTHRLFLEIINFTLFYFKTNVKIYIIFIKNFEKVYKFLNITHKMFKFFCFFTSIYTSTNSDLNSTTEYTISNMNGFNSKRKIKF